MCGRRVLRAPPYSSPPRQVTWSPETGLVRAASAKDLVTKKEFGVRVLRTCLLECFDTPPLAPRNSGRKEARS